MCSQFGFEYSDISATLREVRRVLTATGWFVAISHHADSDLIKAAQAELEIYSVVFDELDIFGKAGKYLAALGDLGGTQEQLQQAIERTKPLATEINSVVESLRQKFPDVECAKEVVNAVAHLAKGARFASPAERVDAVNAAVSDFSMAQARLEDMVKAALSQDDIEFLSVAARELGFNSVHCLRLFGDDNGLAAWQIHLR